MDTPGIEVRTFPTLGGGVLCEVFLDGVEIPGENLVGELDGGWDVLMYTLDFERVTAEKLGGVAWVLDELERAAARRPVGSTALARERLAFLRGELQAARLLSFRAADILDRGLPGSATSAMAKLSGARLVQRVADTAVDLLGLEGLGDGAGAVARRAGRGALPCVGRLDDRRRHGRGAAARDRPPGSRAREPAPRRGSGCSSTRSTSPARWRDRCLPSSAPR